MKMSKKGFTLAELLIVIAIIAVITAIAIPAFSAVLYNAKLQADHSNIHSAYVIYRTGSVLGTLDGIDTIEDTTYYFQKDGSLGTSTDNAYICQVTPDKGDCDASAGCKTEGHTKGAEISITVSDGGKTFTFKLGGKALSTATVPEPDITDTD